MQGNTRGRGAFAAVLAALTVGWAVVCATAAAQEPQVLRADEVQTGSLLLATPNGSLPATRLDTDIGIRVSGLIARTTIRQAFRNDGSDRVEGVYVFPLPDGAAVDRLRMQIGERFIEGEIHEKKQAREVYERARREGRRSGLVEQQRANLFTTSVANLPAGETIVVEIEYLETVRFDDGLFSLRVPLTLTPRYIPGAPLETGEGDRRGSGWAANTDRVPDASLITPPVAIRAADHRVTLDADIEAGVPLEGVVSRYHPVTVAEVDAARGRYRLQLAEDRVPMDHDLELTWHPVPASVPRTALFTETLGGKPHYLLMVLPPDEVADGDVPMPRDLVLVVDTSGSMHGTSIGQAKQALLLALDRLRPVDRFDVVQFNSTTSSLFQASVAATPANLALARRYVVALGANGGTEMRPALERVMSTESSERHLRQIVFITDGSVGNEAELIQLIGAGLGSARLFTVGIGSAPNGWFMRKAAEAGRGSYTYISALHEVGEKMRGLFEKLERPQVTDIEVEWPGGAGDAAFPATVPDLYSGEPVVVSARLPLAPRQGAEVRVTGSAQSGRWGVNLPLSSTREHAGVAALWARAQIEDLLDRERAGGDAGAIRARIVATALDHHLVSPYTSLVAVDKTPVEDPHSPLRTERIPSLLPHGQSARAIFGLPATATASPLHVAAGTACLLLAALLRLTIAPRRMPRHATRRP